MLNVCENKMMGKTISVFGALLVFVRALYVNSSLSLGCVQSLRSI